MKKIKYLCLMILTLICCQNAFSQQIFNGKVVEVTDGKTIVIQLPTKTKITAELGYIEIPEPEQQLHQTVKEHLRNLLLGKDVEFIAQVIMQTRLIGKVYIGEVDYSQQMLRDGAAWYATSQKDRQNAREREDYQIVEAQAKLEKRGVWGIENLKPAWEFRAAKERATRNLDNVNQQAENLENVSTKVANGTKTRFYSVEDQQKLNASMQMWADVHTKPVFGTVGLFSNYIPEINLGYTYTVSSFLEMTDRKDKQRVQCRVIYAYPGEQPNGVGSSYVLGFLSEAKMRKFQQTNNLTILADKQKLDLGKALGFWRPSETGFTELLLYKITSKDLNKIAKAKNLQVSLGGYSGLAKDNLQDLTDKLLNKFN